MLAELEIVEGYNGATLAPLAAGRVWPGFNAMSVAQRGNFMLEVVQHRMIAPASRTIIFRLGKYQHLNHIHKPSSFTNAVILCSIPCELPSYKNLKSRSCGNSHLRTHNKELTESCCTPPSLKSQIRSTT